jgi:signal transduction histidine kinase/type II secretory pathway pseudopilin PulG
LIQRDIRRANTAVAMVLIAVLALALVAVFAGLRAERNRRRAEAAEALSQEQLRLAYTEEARAIRASAETGGRAAAMNAISNAVAIRVSPELRSEAIACLALADLVPEGRLVPTPSDLTRILVDPQLRYYTYGDTAGRVRVNRLIPSGSNLVLDPSADGGAVRQTVVEQDFSPDSSCLSACLADGTIVVWNLASGQLIFTNRFPATSGLTLTPLRGLSFSPDSRHFIFSDPAAQGQIAIYNLATGRRESSGVQAWGKTFRLRPEFQQVAVATDRGVDLLDYPSGTRRQSLNLEVPVITMTWSPDGRRLAVSSADGEIHLWEPESGALSHLTGHTEAAIRLGFNAAGNLLFSASRDGTTRLWDAALGRMVAMGLGFGCSFSPDDQHIMYWKPWAGFGVWRVATSRVYTLHECDQSAGPLSGVDLSPSGRWLVVTQGKGVRLWDLLNGGRETRLPENVTAASVAMDERSLFVCETNGLAQWPLATNLTDTLPIDPAAARNLPLPDGQGAWAMSLSGDGRWAAVELRDRRLVRMDLAGGSPPTLLHGQWRHAISVKGPASPMGAGRFAISPDGQWIATGFDFSSDGPVVWNGLTGELVTNLPVGTSVTAFSADGRWLGLAGISRNSVWSVGDWQLQKQFAREEASLVHGALAFLPGDPIVAISQTRQKVQLRNWPADELVADLIAPGEQSVNSVRISSDGQTLVMATASYLVEVWRLGELRRELAGMGLDWNGQPEAARPAGGPAGPGAAGGPMILAVLGGFALVAMVALATLRRHRLAIERFVMAEAQAAQSHRDLDLAKIELMHSQKMQALGTLATGVAHDFNNLLSVIRMSNKLIGRRTPADLETQELVSNVEQAVLQGKSVVGSVLGFARRSQETCEPLDVSAVVEETVSLLSREFLSGITLTLELERDTPRVPMARGPLEQVVMNLLVNAAEAMQGAGRLRIGLQTCPALPADAWVLRPRPAATYVELSVQDAGPGIAPELRDRLFEPFFTTKNTGVKPGTGLGLSLVYSISQQAGLGLSLASEPGHGACFSVFLPAGSAPVRETHSAQTSHPD